MTPEVGMYVSFSGDNILAEVTPYIKKHLENTKQPYELFTADDFSEDKMYVVYTEKFGEQLFDAEEAFAELAKLTKDIDVGEITVSLQLTTHTGKTYKMNLLDL